MSILVRMAVRIPVSDRASALIRAGELRAVYQPIVELSGNEIVGYEALARGPEGSPLEMPAAMFASAQDEGVFEEFDQACREAALAGALEAGLGRDDLLFVNAEPSGLGEGGVLDRIASGHLARLSVVVELTERALTARPREVLAAVRWLRGRGCRIALDDVGTDPRSLGLMPFLRPDVIKLDRSLTQGSAPASHTARVINAVRAEAERSGALILAEGIETMDHRRRALALGATMGQGWLFGRPQPTPAGRGPDEAGRAVGAGAGLSVPLRQPERLEKLTPFEAIADRAAVFHGDKRLLLSLSRQLEEEAFHLQGESVVLATFQDARFFTAGMRRRYERLARRAALVGAIGVGVPKRPGFGIRGASLAPDDPLRGEWDVVVVGPHFAGAFVARDLGDEGEDGERRFEYFITYDRALVTTAARSLLAQLLRVA